MRLTIRLLFAATVLCGSSACTQVIGYGAQHTLGARLGPCQASKDSVERARGKPYRRHVADDEDVATHAQVFWHEWAYRDVAQEQGSRSDSVTVVGFRWGDGVNGCDVRERLAGVPGPNGRPWQGVGEVPPSED
jgi:hypothetical protein